MKNRVSSILLASFVLAGCQTTVASQSKPGGFAVDYNTGAEMPQKARPNDATLSLYNDKRISFINRWRSKGWMYTIKPKGNAVPFEFAPNLPSARLDKEMETGFLYSYLFYDNGVVKYNGKAKDGRFNRNITDEMYFYTHSSGKSITSYVLGHAICEGYIGSINETIDWPMMSNTIYQGQPLKDLLNMRAGDQHTVDKRHSHYIMGAKVHHRDMGLDTIGELLEGTKKRGRNVFYNNVLADVLANYTAFKAGNNYDELMRKVFQDKIKIKHPVQFEMHRKSQLKSGARSKYYGQMQTRASYSYFITRLDFLRVATAMMKDYQDQTCVGKYMKQIQEQAEPWYQNRHNSRDADLWLNNYATKYGGQFYIGFRGINRKRNIFGTEGRNGQNILIDMDNSRIVVTNSGATGWNTRTLMLNVIRDGKLPK